eukprot:gene26778-biopygen17333
MLRALEAENPTQ